MDYMQGSRQVPNVSKYRSARLPTSTRHAPSSQEPSLAVSNGNDSMTRSRSRYHRKNIPKTQVTARAPQTPADVPRAKQRHLATLAALTGEPFESVSDDDNNAPISQHNSQPQLLPYRAHAKAERETSRPDQNGTLRSRHSGMEADTRGTRTAESGQNIPNTAKATDQSPLSQPDNVTTRATQPDYQSSQQGRTKNSLETRSPDQAQAGSLKGKLHQARDQIPIEQPVERYLSHVERNQGRNGQKQNAPIDAQGNANQALLFLGTDAPVSAINAGERKVLIKYDDSSISLPVNPNTTPLDLMESAAKALDTTIKPQSHRLMEFFHQLALERALRSYENVRDVMNSWEGDVDNHLYLVNKAGKQETDFTDIEGPADKPPEVSMTLYHSPRPGRWDKRWTILREDGQISISKREGEPLENLCHLSDFDIYVPTRHQKRKIKSPKKICFAIKSQQKSSMFLSGQNFIHFFATNDKDLAAKFHQAIWGWRSWYLVHVLGRGRIASTSMPKNLLHTRRGSISSSSHSDRPYNLDHNEPNRRAIPVSIRGGALPTLHAAQKSGGITPPTAFPKHFVHQANDELTVTSLTPTPSTAPQRSNSIRQVSRPNRPTTSRSRSNSMTSKIEEFKAPSQSTRKSPSKRDIPKPLVDLTPMFQEPPQHTRKGRGVTAEPGKQLVDQIADPELEPGFTMIPSATTWRRPGDAMPALNTASSPPQRQATRHWRGKQSTDERRPFDLHERSGKVSGGDEPFTGGLLSKQTQHGQVQAALGHVTQSSFRATNKPLINFDENFKPSGQGLSSRKEESFAAAH